MSLPRPVIVIVLVFIAVLAIAFMALLAVGSAPPVVAVVNQSTLALSNVVLSGTGFSKSIGHIPAGASHKLTVLPTSESDIRIVFDADGRRIDTNDLAYIEASGGHYVVVTIHPDLKVSSVWGMRRLGLF